MMNWSDKNKDMGGHASGNASAPPAKAISEAKLRGELVPQWRDGKVVWVRPEEVELPPEQQDQATPPTR